MLRPAVARVVLLLLAVCAPLAALHAQTHPEIIRGRVTTDSGRVIVGAEVIATMAPNREVFRTMSDTGGRYQLNIAAGTGDYLVYIATTGRRALRKRVTRVGTETTFTVDARLALDVAVIAAVRTTAQRTRPPRGDDAPSTIGGMDATYGGVSGDLPPDLMGDLSAMASTIPGVTITPDGGISVLGIDPSQNKTTLDGLAFDATSLPRDLQTITRVAASIYDPTVGGFGGALTSVTIRPGQTVEFGHAHLTVDAPQMQAADATARQLGQRYTNLSGSYEHSAELVQDSWVYRAAIQAGRRSSPAPSLLGSDADALARLGVSRDSADHFLELLGGLGVPVTAQGFGSDRVTTSVSGAVRLDRAQSNPASLQTDTRARLTFVGTGNYQRSDQPSASALALPGHGNQSEYGTATAQAILSQYFGKDAAYLSETKTAVSVNTQQSNPYLALPGGYVRVTSALDDGSEGISGLQFGGANTASDTKSWRWEANNELSFNPIRAVSHRIKLYSQAEIDGYSQTTQANGLGTFTYNSLADLAANTPASYSRTLYTPDRTGGEASGAFALADYWVKSPDLQFVFGPRLEWDAFTQAPRDNPEITQLFGVHTNVTPSSVHVSPRFGFNWLYRGLKNAGRGGGVTYAALGSALTQPKGALRGGFGEFRSQLAPSLVSDAIASTGLPGSTTQRLNCVGPATPVPDWRDYLADAGDIPESCAAGAGTTPFVDAAPSVQVFDPSYTAPHRWTGNLGWSSNYKFLYYDVNGVYSRNFDQPSYVDLNYTGVQQFALANEANRPVYVAPASIVPSTGLVSPLDSRLSTDFGSVVSRRSDLRSEVKQVTVNLTSYTSRPITQALIGNVSYVFTSMRSLTRGYDGTTFGDPRQTAWATGFTPQHQIRFSLGYIIPKIQSAVTTYWGFQSGAPYTPIVAGDINGDGLSNDRAFVFDPAHAPSASVASGLSTLLASTTSRAHDCLERQLGQVAAVNSCRRPWSATTMNVRFDWNKIFGEQYQYIKGSINFSNPLSGLDLLLHGSDNLRGWGTPAAPDPTLYFVRGFDPTTQRFIYEVNPRFGNTRPSLAALLNPFRVTIDFSFSITPNLARQNFDVYVRPTRSAPGVRPPADTIYRRLTSSAVGTVSPFAWIVTNADSLLLTPEQLSAVEAVQAHARVRTDSTNRAIANYLASLPMDADPAAALAHMNDARRSINPTNNGDGALIGRILTPIQFRLLPADFARISSIPAPKP
ncbi:MAG TPA: carboxypeptidase-like regulatory domain-containing protein [Gemmatimonadaceae bacterium]|jgi:hypothetical protein